MTSHVDCDEEDEDVVIAGSELHEALSNMGYSDYEVVPVPHQQSSTVAAIHKPASMEKSDSWVFRVLHKNIFNIYRCIMKDRKALRKQLTIISGAQHLLDDHAELIKNLLEEDRETEMNGRNYFLSCLKYAAGAAVGYYFINRLKPSTWLVTFPALTAARYKYTKWRIDRDLKRLISEQTELHYTYKRALRILNHSFRMNTNGKQSGSKFTDIGAEKLKFLQPITEKTVKSLETMSIAYYETTLRMVELLPDSKRQDFESQITYFDKESFTNYGEITYNSLKQLFYRFLLIQSEMLLSIAVLRHSDPVDLYDEIKRGIRIDRRVEQLLKLTTEQRMWMIKTVDDFQKHKLAAVENKYRGFPGSKWQDLYVRLHLTSHKLQKAYDNITSILEEIENHLDRGTDETELMETLKTKLDDVCNDADKAKDLALLSALLISKMGKTRDNRAKEDVDDDDGAVQISRPGIPVVKDTDPEIIDEVFEEYIRERYSEALRNEDGNDYLERTYKLDKLLSKNLMSELKEALIDKEKDTKERESRALQRMNKSSKDDTVADDVLDGNLLSDLDAEIESGGAKQQLKLESTNSSSRDEPGAEKPKLNCIPRPPPPPMPREFIQLRNELKEVEKVANPRPTCSVPLPSSRSIPMPLFLSDNEETFIGSGENSDEEEEAGAEAEEEEQE